jgi:uncharacterized membrane protein YvbJ
MIGGLIFQLCGDRIGTIIVINIFIIGVMILVIFDYFKRYFENKSDNKKNKKRRKARVKW